MKLPTDLSEHDVLTDDTVVLKNRIEALEGQVCVLAVALRAFARNNAGMGRVTDAMDEILDWQIDEQRIRELVDGSTLLAPDGTRTN
ncbi:MAG: hypothetical protein ABIS07_02675 [Dokdonella sp.]